jgi:hypothetical protein
MSTTASSSLGCARSDGLYTTVQGDLEGGGEPTRIQRAAKPKIVNHRGESYTIIAARLYRGTSDTARLDQGGGVGELHRRESHVE